MSGLQRRGGLGRGLGALIPSGPIAADTAPAAEPVSPETSDIMSSDPVVDRTPDPGSARASNGSGTARNHNRVPSMAALSSSTANSVYFDPAPVPGASLHELRPAEITTNPRQPRQVFDDEALAELAHSIREFGVLQPIVVRPQGDGFELVMGERRLRAAQAAGLATIPAIVRHTDDDAMLRDALLENIHRAQLNPLEEAAAYQQLLEEFGTTHEELATRIGRSRSQVSNTIRLMNLSIPVQRRVAAGVLSAGHARALLGLGNRDQQDDLAGRIVAEGLSVRATEELVALAATAGADGRAPRRPAAPRMAAPAVEGLADRLSSTLDTRVKVDVGRRKGRITVEFGSVDDLERIVALIAPQADPAPDDWRAENAY